MKCRKSFGSQCRLMAWMVVFVAVGMGACSSGPKPKPEKPVYVEAKKEKTPPPMPAVVPVPVAQPVPGQVRPAPPMNQPSEQDVETAKSEAAGKKPYEIIDAANAKAQAQPVKDGYYNAMQVYDFAPGVLYQVYAAPLKLTSIEFGPGEQVESVGVGDSTRWIIGRTSAGAGSKKREVVVVKPVRAYLNTNMTVTTNRRIYQLELHSYKDTYMAAVSWNYPRDLVTRFARREQKEATQADAKGGGVMTVGASPEKLNFAYGFVVQDPDSPPSWMPLRVFDDGTKTYVQFPPEVMKREAPALFVLSDDGKTQIVNYRVRGDYYVVDRLFEMAQLRLGEKSPVTVGIEHLKDKE